MVTEKRFKTINAIAPLRFLSLIMIVIMLVTAAPTAIALDSFRGVKALAEQTFTLHPEKGVTVALSGMLPQYGHAGAVTEEMDDEDVLHAYDITIYYADGSEFEPDDGATISVSFQSEQIADAIDNDATLSVEHITDSGEVEDVALLSTEEDEAVFDAESFSVYVIRTHVTNDENLKPRKTFHYLSADYTSIENGQYYQSAPYRFPNKLNEMVSTQTVTDGEALQEIVLPDNNTSGLFYGWYEVVMDEYDQEHDLYKYHWGSGEPHHVAFNEPIEVKESKDTDVYLAPLFGHYRFLTFHQDVRGSANANTIITRKLITLGNDRKCTLKISDVRAPSTNPNRIVFWGWEYTHYHGDQEGKTEVFNTVNTDDSEIPTNLTIEDQNVVGKLQPDEEDIKKMIFDIWPVFKEARWIYFESGSEGANYVPPQFIMLDEPPAGFGNVPVRAGYDFQGWYYKTAGGESIQVTDKDANILNTTKELTTGVSIKDSKLEMTREAEEQTFYAEWLPSTQAKYHVIVWKQKVTDDKNLTKEQKTYDFESYSEITGSTTQNARETSAYTNGKFEQLTTNTATAKDFIGFHFAYATVSDNGLGDYQDKVNPNGSTVVNVYYDRDLMKLTYYYQTAHLPDGTQYNSGNYTYIEVLSNAGDLADGDSDLYGKVGDDFVPLQVKTTSEYCFIFPQKYTATTDNDTGVTYYGVVNQEYVPLTTVPIYKGTVSSYTYYYVPSSSTSNDTYYILSGGKFTSTRLYYNTRDKKWYKSYSGGTYSNPFEGTRYNRTYSYNSISYTGNIYTISGDALITTTNTSGTRYGIASNGTVYPLSSIAVNSYQYYYNDTQYTGTRYERGADSTGYFGDRYLKTDSGFTVTTGEDGTLYGYRNGAYEPIVYGETTIYSWTYGEDHTEYPDTSPRYRRFEKVSTSGYSYQVIWTGLFAQPFSKYGYVFPSGYMWNEASNGSGTTQTLLSGFTNLLSGNNASNTDYKLYCQGNANQGTLYHLRQKLDGTYSLESAYYDIAHVSTGNVSFTFSNKFDGYVVSAYSTSFSETAAGAKAIAPGDQESITPGTDTYYVYHKLLYDLSFTYNDNYNGHVFELSGLKYQQPLSAYENFYTPATRDHYVFTGWYEDESCTKLFNFNSTMPAANKMVYAGWKAVRYRVQVDPDGGEFPLGGNYSTYFNVDYDEPVAEYGSTKRNYVEDPNGEYLYVKVTYDKVKDMTDSEGNPLDLAGAYRKAFYIKKTEVGTTYEKTFYVGDTAYSFKDVMTLQQFQQFVDMNTTYSPTEDNATEYRLVSWHTVDSMGNVSIVPFNFSNRVESDTTIRARWMRVGKYSLVYNPTMTSTGITGTMARVNDPLESDRKFSDASPVIILQEPTDLTLGNGSPAKEYVFRGWRIVDGVTREPLEDNVFYDPGDTYILNARMAGPQGVIHMEAYYEKSDVTVRRVDVTSVTLDANADEKGVVNTSGLLNNKYEYADVDAHQIKIERQNNNFDVNLSKYIKNFSHTDGHFLLGWDTVPKQGDYIPEYYADAFVGVNKNNMPNTLYAVWEPMVYLTLQNFTSYDVEFDLKFEYNGTVYEGHANTMTGEYERQAFSDDKTIVTDKPSTGEFKVKLPPKDPNDNNYTGIQLVLPEGAGATYTVTGSYVDDAGKKALIVYNTGDEKSTTIEYNNGYYTSDKYWKKNGTKQTTTPVPYSTSGTLKVGKEGQTVMFTEKDPETELDLIARYYDINTGNWVDGSKTTGAKADVHFSLPSGVHETASGDGYKTTVHLINNNQNVTFGLNVRNYDSENYKFIGWYTSSEAMPNAITVDGKASDFGNPVISGLAVPSTLTTYYALFVPYVSGDLKVSHSERSDTAGHCAETNGLSLNVQYSNVNETLYGDRNTAASYTIPASYVYEKNTSGSVTLTVGAVAHEGSNYEATYRNTVRMSPDEHLTATYSASVPELFSDSETVKGLKVLKDLNFYSVFSRGYSITYKYTARDGNRKEYVLKGNADSFDDFGLFVIEHTPYERTLAGDTVWDIDNMTLEVTDYGMSAVLEEKSNIRSKCTVTIIYEGGYKPTEQVGYGETFTEDQAQRHLAKETNNDGLTFDYWDIVNTKTGEHIAKCYSRKFTFAVWNDYTITPHYAAKPETKAEEGTLITIDYIDTSRNQWTNDENGSSKIDYVVADMDITFINGSDKIIDAVDENGNNPYQLGVIFEICAPTTDGSYDVNNLKVPVDTARTKRSVEAIISSTTKQTGSAKLDGVSFYYSKIDINEDTVSTFNRSEFARSFNTASVKNYVFRVYAYMKTPNGEVVLSDPKYVTFYEYAAMANAIG